MAAKVHFFPLCRKQNTAAKVKKTLAAVTMMVKKWIK